MSKTYYIKSGNTFSVTDSQNIDIRDSLPAGSYVVLHDPLKGFWLSQVDTMTVPHKIYGVIDGQVDRIYNTFSTRDRNTGILLNGEKGSGKSLTLALLSHKFISNNFPVIIINSAFSGDAFNTFISGISQPCMIAFDEFDKTYDNDDQENILTLLDGVFNSRKLFVLTCNDSWKISSFMLNRPGRIFYNLSYRRLEEDAIREYCNDILINKQDINGVVKVAGMVDAFNFDMLKALVEEMNRYNETAKEAVEMLNIRPARARGIEYNFVTSVKGKVLQTGVLDDDTTPLSGKAFSIYTEVPNPKYSEETKDVEAKTDWRHLSLTVKDMIRMDSSGYVFEKEGLTVTIIKEETRTFSYSSDYF